MHRLDHRDDVPGGNAAGHVGEGLGTARAGLAVSVHTFASRLVQQGVPLYEVMQLTGHKSLVMVQRYAHFAPEFQERAIGVHNNYWYDSGTVGDLPQKQEMLDTKIPTISVGLKLVEPWGIDNKC